MKDSASKAADERAARLAQALRDNLRRRKAQSRETDAQRPADRPEGDGEA